MCADAGRGARVGLAMGLPRDAVLPGSDQRHAAALVRHPPARGRLRHPDHPGTARSQRCRHHDDLHARAQPRRSRRAESVRRPDGPRDGSVAGKGFAASIRHSRQTLAAYPEGRKKMPTARLSPESRLSPRSPAAYPDSPRAWRVLLGGGERLIEGVDLRALGYECAENVASEKATHVVLARLTTSCRGRSAARPAAYTER